MRPSKSTEPGSRPKINSSIATASVVLLVTLATPTAHTAPSECGRGSAGKSTSRVRPIVVSDAATERQPLEVRYDQPPSLLFVGPPLPGARGVETPIRVVSTHEYPELHLRVEWPTPSVSDLDLFLYDRWNEQIASSEGWNVDAVDQAVGNRAGAGFEYIAGVAVPSCARYSVGTGSWHSPGEKVTLKLWLGRGE